MAQPTQLNATEQDTLVKQIGLSLLRAAPRDWQRVNAEYRAVGKFHELTGEISTSDGSTVQWVATHDIATLFGRLRAAMYREGRGTWFNARYTLDHPSSYNLEYDRDEPTWDLAPPPQAYADELRMFPRSEDNVPEWLMRRMSGLGPERAGPRFRIARVFDGVGAAGRPVIKRAELDAPEQDRLLDYLDGAPVVLPGRGHDIDRLSPDQEGTVPVAFHSDGEWIWPAAVNFYLREYGVAPEPDLVAHIRSNGFRIPDVPEQRRQAAAGYVTRGGPGPEGAAGGSAQDSTFHDGERHANNGAEPGLHAGNALPGAPDPTVMRHDSGQVDPPTTFTPAGHAASASGAGSAGGGATAVSPGSPLSRHAVADDDGGPPTQFGQTPVPAHGEPVLADLQERLEELDIPAGSYSIGEPAERGWSVEEVDGGWRVGWYDGKLTSPAVFGDVEDAAAFMLGKLLLDQDGLDAGARIPSPAPSAPSAPSAPPRAPAPAPPPAAPTQTMRRPEPDRASMTTMLSPEIATGSRPVPLDATQAMPATNAVPAPTRTEPPRPERRPEPPPETRRPEPSRPEPSRGGQGGAPSGGQGGQQWPIQPMNGEPPLTLFRGKELRELPAGSELDRFGGPNGNLTYAAGTPFEERSLVPEWVSRPYHVYRVQRPLEALAGVAIPWFNQPGGGSAYLLPGTIEELLAEGDLIELDPGEPPVD